jgi:prepilin-type N-terminal cleavage/methylation domain-containing protein
MVTIRKTDAGFTLTETMVVVVILSILAAISTPLLVRDNTARKGRTWANTVAQILQRARFQAMGDRANIHVLLHRTRIDVYRRDDPVPPATAFSYPLLSSTPGPVADDTGATIAIWDANTTHTPPTGRVLGNETQVPATGGIPPTNEIVFTPLGPAQGNASWWIYVRNELLASNHPDASFVITVGGLTGHVSSNDKVTLP